MTGHSSFKRLVRTRMSKTGESYTAARAVLLRADAEPKAAAPLVTPLVTDDDTIRRRTGRGWEQWFDLLDDWGAAEQPHREIARWVAGQLGIEPLVWEAQAVTTSYERARGLRAVGQRTDGFAVTVSRTFAVPADRLFDIFVDESTRQRWLPEGELRQRTATRPKSARFDFDDGRTRVLVTFTAKDADRSTIALEHSRLTDAEEADQMRALWRQAMGELRAEVEAGGSDG